MKGNFDRNAWTNYFKEFSARNMARPTRLESFGEFGAQEEKHGLPFEGIAMDTSLAGPPSVEIMLGGHGVSKARHLTLVIPDVQEITPKGGLDGRDEALEIVSGEGYRHLLRFEREARMAAPAH